MKTTGYFDSHPANRPRIFAHRGLTFKGEAQVLDENTIPAFELALEAGADYLESDIQVTRDNIPVLFHDLDLSRLVGSKSLISNLNLNELQSIKLPFGGSIPTLSQALTSFPNANFNLDIKSPAAESVGIRTILDLEASNRVLISSFSEKSRKRALATSPLKLATSAGSAKVLACYLSARAKNIRALDKQVEDIDALQIPTRRFGLDFTHPKFLEQILPTGVELHYWTINEPRQMQELFQLGAHGLVTDRTDLAVKTFS